MKSTHQKDKEIKKLKEDVEYLSYELANGKSTVKELDRILEEKSGEIEALANECEVKEEKINFLEEKVREQQAEIEQLKKIDIEKIRNEERIKAESRLMETLKAEKKKMEDIHNDVLKDAENKVANLREEINFLKTSNQELQNENDILRIVADSSSENGEEVNSSDREEEIKYYLEKFINSHVQTYSKYRVKCIDFRKRFQQYLIEQEIHKLSRFEFPLIITYMNEMGYSTTRSDTNYYRGIYLKN